MLADGGFRSDLYHRIADWVVEMPPLRERRADIPNLAAHFLAAASANHGVRCEGISRGAVEALVGYGWPGNVRQLEREMARAALFIEDGALLERAQLQPAIAGEGATPAEGGLRHMLERIEREEIKKALEAADGDVPAAARRLDLPRSSLYRRMQVLGLKARDESTS